MKNALTLLGILLIALTLCACPQKVTETGNPCPGGDCIGSPVGEEPPVVGDPDAPTAPSMEGEDQEGEDDEDEDESTKLSSWYDVEVGGFSVGYPEGWMLVDEGTGDGWASATFLQEESDRPSRVFLQWYEAADTQEGEEAFAARVLPGVRFTRLPEGAIGEGMLAGPSTQGAEGRTQRLYLTHAGSRFVTVMAYSFPEDGADLRHILEHIEARSGETP